MLERTEEAIQRHRRGRLVLNNRATPSAAAGGGDLDGPGGSVLRDRRDRGAGVRFAWFERIQIVYLYPQSDVESGPLFHFAGTPFCGAPPGKWTSAARCIPVRLPPLPGRWHRDAFGRQGPPDVGVMINAPDARITSVRTQHPQSGEVTALWIEDAGRCIVFTGDTAYHLAVENFACGADRFNHGAMLAHAAEASAAGAIA